MSHGPFSSFSLLFLPVLTLSFVDEQSLKPRKFLIDVEETMKLVLEHEDVEGKFQVRTLLFPCRILDFEANLRTPNRFTLRTRVPRSSLSVLPAVTVTTLSTSVPFLPFPRRKYSDFSSPSDSRYLHALQPSPRTRTRSGPRSEADRTRRGEVEREPRLALEPHDPSLVLEQSDS